MSRDGMQNQDIKRSWELDIYIRLWFTVRLTTDLIRIASRSEKGTSRTGTKMAVNKSCAAALKNSGETSEINPNDVKTGQKGAQLVGDE